MPNLINKNDLKNIIQDAIQEEVNKKTGASITVATRIVMVEKYTILDKAREHEQKLEKIQNRIVNEMLKILGSRIG